MLAVVAGAAVYYARSRGAGAPPESAAISSTGAGTAAAVTVAAARRRPMHDTVTVTGTLKAERQAAVSAKMLSRIASVLVHTGDRVRRGQPLIRLDGQDAAAQVRSAQ